MKTSIKKTKSPARKAAPNKQTPIAFEPENRAFLERIQQEIGHNRWSFAATVNFAIEQLRNSNIIGVK